MIDTNLIKDDSEAVIEALKSRNYILNRSEFLKNLKLKRKKSQTQTEDLQAKRNALSKSMVC